MVVQQISSGVGMVEDKTQLLSRNVQRFRGGLVFQAHRLLYHSTLGLKVMKKKEEKRGMDAADKAASLLWPPQS